MEMTNALDYLKWRGDLSFDADPVNEVDAFILSQLSTPDYEGIVPEDAESVTVAEMSEAYFQTHDDSVKNLGVIQSRSVLPMLRQLSGMPRFSDLKVHHYVNRVSQKNEEQFSAITIDLPGNVICISFRGTDNTIIGWKEDFQMAVKNVVPAQKDALRYLKNRSWENDSDIILVGHSKGGNLAVYAALYAPLDIKKRILAVYNFDGPGFAEDTLKSPRYTRIRKRVHTIISRNSLVGMIFNPPGNIRVVNTDAAGLMAHDGFTWEVSGKEFVRCGKVSEGSVTFHAALNRTLRGMSDEARSAFIDDFFGILLSTGAVTLSDLLELKPREMMRLVDNLIKDKATGEFNRLLLENIVKRSKPTPEEG